MIIGNKVKLTNNAKQTYADQPWVDKVLVIIKSARSTKEHQGYDMSMYPSPLFDLETEDGEEVNSSLYAYELVKA